MYTVILALHIFVCFLLIIAVLIQNSKGSDLGAALGGGSGEMFGPKAPANIMNKITTVIAACFLVLSLILAVLSSSGQKSIMRNVNVLSEDTPAKTIDVNETTEKVSDTITDTIKDSVNKMEAPLGIDKQPEKNNR